MNINCTKQGELNLSLFFNGFMPGQVNNKISVYHIGAPIKFGSMKDTGVQLRNHHPITVLYFLTLPVGSYPTHSERLN